MARKKQDAEKDLKKEAIAEAPKPAPKDDTEAIKAEEPRAKADTPEAIVPAHEDGKADGGPASEVDRYAAARAVRREGHRPEHYDLDAIAKDLQRGVKARVAVGNHRIV